MRNWQRWTLAFLALCLVAIPGQAIEEEHKDVEGCCWNCAHYSLPLPGGGEQPMWSCMALSFCQSGYLDCYEHVDGSKPCIMMWSCSIF